MSRFSTMLVSGVVALAFVGCGPESAEELEELGVLESELATLEYNIANSPEGDYIDGPCGSTLTSWGGMDYEEVGDQFWVSDRSYDGLSVGVHWRLADGSRRGICRNASGSSTLKACNKDFIEGKTIEMRMGRCNGTTSDCSKLSSWIAEDWTVWKSCKT